MVVGVTRGTVVVGAAVGGDVGGITIGATVVVEEVVVDVDVVVVDDLDVVVVDRLVVVVLSGATATLDGPSSENAIAPRIKIRMMIAPPTPAAMRPRRPRCAGGSVPRPSSN